MAAAAGKITRTGQHPSIARSIHGCAGKGQNLADTRFSQLSFAGLVETLRFREKNDMVHENSGCLLIFCALISSAELL